MKKINFILTGLMNKNHNILCFAKEINEFLRTFVANQLDVEKEYGFSYKNGDFLAKWQERTENTI